MMAGADCHYNCHAFAWGWTGQSSVPDITYRPDGWMDADDADRYIYDGSFVYVPLSLSNYHYAEIIKYDYWHSAVVLSNGNLVSKWNDGPLYEHALSDTPFGTNYLYYIRSPYITGSSTVDAEGTTFTLHNLIDDVELVEWEVSSNYLSIDGADDEMTCIVVATASSSNAWVKAKFNYHGADFYCKAKIVTAEYCDGPVPPGTIYEYTNCPYYYVQYWVTNVPGQTYTWFVEGDGYISSGQGSNMITVQTPGPGGYFGIAVRSENACEYSTFHYQQFETPNCYMMVLSPNPATDLLKIELKEEPSEEATVNIHNTQSIKMMSTTLSNKEKTIDISALKEGIYYVTVQMKNKRITGSFIKK
jgi:hypothetical protein